MYWKAGMALAGGLALLVGCASGPREPRHTLDLSSIPQEGVLPLALPLELVAPHRDFTFRFADGRIEEIKDGAVLSVMIGTGAAWTRTGGRVDCYTYTGLKPEDDYVSVDWEPLGFSEATEQQIRLLAERNGVERPGRVYVLGTYPLLSRPEPEGSSGRVVRVDDAEQVRYLYVFEEQVRGEHIRVVRARSQAVRFVEEEGTE